MHIPHSSTLQRDFGVSMTPMIDIVFLLLIFFVCTASFQITESILPSPLAISGTTITDLPPELTEPELERVVIVVSQHGDAIHLTVNGHSCPSLGQLSDLLTALAAVDVRLPTLLDFDDDLSFGTAIEVYDCCRLAKLERIQFVAEVKP